MNEIGVRELKRRASEILRRVREERESFAITHRGRVVARLVPSEVPAERRRRADSVWAEMDDLAREVSGAWAEHASAEAAVSEQRR